MAKALECPPVVHRDAGALGDAAEGTRERLTRFRAMEAMYSAAPVNAPEQHGTRVVVTDPGRAVCVGRATERFHHSANALHGSVYFKLMDDAAFFAAQSYNCDYFVLTASFTTYLTRPVATGLLVASGAVVSKSASLVVCDAVLRDERGTQVARGSGTFLRGRTRLASIPSYASALARELERPTEPELPPAELLAPPSAVPPSKL